MTRQELEIRMAEAFREDRERLFKVIDSMRNQPKYADRLTEIEAIANTWRDIPQGEDFPNITHPQELPEWFPKVKFFSRWEKDVYIEKALERAIKGTYIKLKSICTTPISPKSKSDPREHSLSKR